ncbi:hypothetical protein KGQ20_03110 [Catenulispora sp. NF23]|uniref:Uncharacterized protein n=1 Tax=Catenulispora pinistramenti TaxID=2705254 RepID=A0ABS5KY25_9ACTN|nr:hypothetical protein [Catenulispora pinistramenti]MBS2531756.1 hypothetical protein [Catenulispora pinistramenti]MBS2550922.1 hypothetical protein [Catenulispora pinistramenti]
MTDTPATTPDAATKRSAAVVLGGCCLGVLLVLIGSIGLVVHFATEKPQSPYRVTFAKAGDKCGSGAKSLLILDQTSGDVLTCGLISFSDGGDASRSVFSAAEVQKITDLSKSLAGSDDSDSDAGNGSTADTALSNADQQKVEHLAEDIGRRHGRPPTSPSTLDRVTGVGGVWFLAFGLALLLAQGLWGQRRLNR